MSYTIVIRSEDASSRSSVADEANSDFSVNIPAVIPEDNTSQRFNMSLKAVGMDVDDLGDVVFEVHVDVSSAMNFYDTKTKSASTLVGICSASNASDATPNLYFPHAKLISSFSKVVANPNYSTIRVRYVELVAQTILTKTTPAVIEPNLVVLEFTPL